MENPPKRNSAGRILLTAAAFVVVVAGMRAASPILVPFLLSVFIALIFSPALVWLQRKRFPDALAILVILAVIVGVGWLLANLVGNSLNQFLASTDEIKIRLGDMQNRVIEWMKDKGLEISEGDEDLKQLLNPATALELAANTLLGLKGVLTNAFLIFLAVVFMLLEAAGFPRKLHAALDKPEESLKGFSQFTESVKRYLAIKTLFSALTGFLVWVWLRILGVQFAMVWGMVAFLLNYVPNIGSIIAAVPAVLMALVQFDTPGKAVLVIVGYVAVNIGIGSFTEPRFLGRELGLSTLVVFLSLVFWGWVLGPVGMLLSVPLTMILKIALGSSAETRWISVLLGPDPGERSIAAAASASAPETPASA